MVSFVYWRAKCIKDPVARLRYLRRSVSLWSRLPATRTRRSPVLRLASFALLAFGVLPLPTVVESRDLIPRTPPRISIPEQPVANVWQVEQTDTYEIYSNGLRIEKYYSLPPGEPAEFISYSLTTDIPRKSTRPYGIVFHATESDAFPFDETQNIALQRAGRGILQYVRLIRAYHYVIDRFGRVWRVVPDNEVADHAGNSVWSDENSLFINLNQSFLGISFEGTTSGNETGQAPITPPQIHAGKLLTEMLRSRDGIRERNCITHAQVSVNPANMGLGYHTDWADHFPFDQIGLNDNYHIPPPAITLFGFSYDGAFRSRSGERLWRGLDAADAELQQLAVAQRTTVPELRRSLSERYRHLYNRIKELETAKEKTH